MDSLVKKLLTGKHAVEFEPRTESFKEIQERLNNGFVFVKFTETQGGTELGINVDKNLTDLNNTDFANGKGKLRVVGTCQLNFHNIRCIADVDLKTRKGKSNLELVNENESETTN